ncbi:hypothetical protein JMUB5056_1505 [Leptotrichia hongkongensis]|uniref:Flavodoxin-like fold domain-containing protein n=1 Tax=Leptotrichia hongkongensis TaxID=554406 RepID=A0A510L7G9_9FUSO|nr:hypothetical protein [Leptotrichia hongkongensis]BBM59918.1 hypothetical protein JMUB5056_1505 [Leptotrichia hongkongensis]
MKISIINGSPKAIKSNSEILGNYLSSLFKENEIKKYYSISFRLNDENKNEIYNSDVLIFLFPLYVDGIPSNLLKLLVEFEKEKVIKSGTKIYCIANNGFYEGKQNRLAILQMKNWCEKVKADWGQGIGAGAGELLPYLKKSPLGQGPLKNLGKVLDEFSANIITLKSDEDIYINPNWLKSLYFFQATISWILKGRKNNLRVRELFRKSN